MNSSGFPKIVGSLKSGCPQTVQWVVGADDLCVRSRQGHEIVVRSEPIQADLKLKGLPPNSVFYYQLIANLGCKKDNTWEIRFTLTEELAPQTHRPRKYLKTNLLLIFHCHLMLSKSFANNSNHFDTILRFNVKEQLHISDPRTDILFSDVEILPTIKNGFAVMLAAYGTQKECRCSIASQNIFHEFCTSSTISTTLFESKKLTDFKIRTAKDGKILALHKSVLALQSAVFDQMFSTETTQKSVDRLDIEEFDANSVKCFAQCLYQCADSDECAKHAEVLFQLASRYKASRLKFAAEQWLCLGLDPAIICTRLVLAHLHRATQLKKVCIEVIVEKKAEVSKLQEWQDFKKNYPALMVEILDKDGWSNERK